MGALSHTSSFKTPPESTGGSGPGTGQPWLDSHNRLAHESGASCNAKQFLGLQDPQNRTPQAVQRTAPPALYVHTLVILRFAEHGHFDVEAYRRAHPWYARKRTPSFADMLACLKTACLRESPPRYAGQKPPSAKKLLPLFRALEAAA